MPTVRSVAIGCLVATGSALEPAPEAGISHLLEHMLFRGTAEHRPEEIDQIFDAMGSELDAHTDREVTSLSTRVLDRHLPEALEVMAEMLWRPAMQQLEAERQVVLEEIAMYEDDPQERIFDLLGQAIFGDHPLGRPVIGNASTVSEITLEDLFEYHTDRYTPGNIVIAAAGSVDHDELVRLTEALRARSLSSPTTPTLTAAGQAPRSVTPMVLPAAGAEVPMAVSSAASLPAPPRLATSALHTEQRTLFCEKDTEQYHLCIGGEGIAHDDERRFALRVLEAVLGASASSRLFQEIRERRGLAYSVFCFSSSYATSGEFGVYVGTRPENLEQTTSVLLAQLSRAIEEPASSEELHRARESVKGRIVLALESTGARMARLGGSVLHRLPLLSVEEMIERIDAVGIDELKQLAAELFEPARLSVAAIGPGEARFREAIAPLEAIAA